MKLKDAIELIDECKVLITDEDGLMLNYMVMRN